jgi:hypothetical protein
MHLAVSGHYQPFNLAAQRLLMGSFDRLEIVEHPA